MSEKSTNLRTPSEEKPWLKHFPQESLMAEIPYRTIYASVQKQCQTRPKAKALYYYGASITYGELLEKIDTVAKAFYGMGIRPGDMVSFLTPTTPEAIYSLYAINKIGAIPNFVDPRMDIQRIYDATEGVKSKLLVTIDLAWPKVAALMSKLSVKQFVVMSPNNSLPAVAKVVRTISTAKTTPKIPYGPNILRWTDFLKKGRGLEVTQCPFEEGSVAAITYTGGTTGTPKGVMLTNDNLNAMADSFCLAGVQRYSENDRFLEIMPIFAAYGVGCGVHMPLSMGFELVVIPKFTPDQLGDLIRKYRPSHMMGVPAFYEQIMHSKAMWDFKLDFLLTTGCGGDTMNPGLEGRFNRFLNEHGAPFCLSQGYGMSEMAGAATCCYSNIYKDDSAGIPLLATTCGIFDPETGEELGYYRQGEICMTGRQVMKGYFNNEAETEHVIRRHADGKLWVHSGDIGYMDEDGFIYIKGRIKQIIIKFDGHKVFPVSIEGVMNRHKAVGTCAVVGIQDPDHAQGSVPLGIVELKHSLADQVDQEALRKELLDLCDRECEERGKPADVVFIDQMLRTALNKNDYRRLTELYKDYQIRPR